MERTNSMTSFIDLKEIELTERGDEDKPLKCFTQNGF